MLRESKRIVDGTVLNLLQEHLLKQKDTHSDGSDRGLTDRYFEQMKKQSGMSTFSDEQLLMIILDVMFPALSAMPSVVAHAIKLVMHHPDVLEKVQGELDTVIGTGRHVTWDDRKKYVTFSRMFLFLIWRLPGTQS